MDVSQILWDGHENNANVLDTNITAVYTSFIGFLPLLLASNTDVTSPYHQRHIQSQFIVISSVSALHHHGQTGYIYNASKAGVIHMARCLSNDFAHLGIRVNSVAPGTFVTEMIEHYFPDPAALSRPGGVPKESIPAGRAGTPEVSQADFQ